MLPKCVCVFTLSLHNTCLFAKQFYLPDSVVCQRFGSQHYILSAVFWVIFGGQMIRSYWAQWKAETFPFTAMALGVSLTVYVSVLCMTSETDTEQT